MKIKLKKDVLESGGLPSVGSHQGFTKNIWQSLNNGDTVEVDSIPERSKSNIEQVKSKNKTEGDFKTPRGTFKFGTLYWRPDRVKKPFTKLYCKKIKKKWVGAMIVKVNFIIKKLK